MEKVIIKTAAGDRRRQPPLKYIRYAERNDQSQTSRLPKWPAWVRVPNPGYCYTSDRPQQGIPRAQHRHRILRQVSRKSRIRNWSGSRRRRRRRPPPAPNYWPATTCSPPEAFTKLMPVIEQHGCCKSPKPPALPHRWYREQRVWKMSGSPKSRFP